MLKLTVFLVLIPDTMFLERQVNVATDTVAWNKMVMQYSLCCMLYREQRILVVTSFACFFFFSFFPISLFWNREDFINFSRNIERHSTRLARYNFRNREVDRPIKSKMAPTVKAWRRVCSFRFQENDRKLSNLRRRKSVVQKETCFCV